MGRKVIDNDIKIKIVNEEGKEVPVGHVGEIVIKSPNQMINYVSDRHNSPIQWIHTEDQGLFYCLKKL